MRPDLSTDLTGVDCQIQSLLIDCQICRKLYSGVHGSVLVVFCCCCCCVAVGWLVGCLIVLSVWCTLSDKPSFLACSFVDAFLPCPRHMYAENGPWSTHMQEYKHFSD